MIRLALTIFKYFRFGDSGDVSDTIEFHPFQLPIMPFCLVMHENLIEGLNYGSNIEIN